LSSNFTNRSSQCFFCQNLKYSNEYFIWPNWAPQSDSLHWPWPKYIEEWKENDKLVIWVSQPTIRVYLPDSLKNTRAAIVICPGRGYNILEIEKEGYAVAKKLNDLGIAAIVLIYRHYSEDEARKDALRALQYVKANALNWRRNTNGKHCFRSHGAHNNIRSDYSKYGSR